MNNKIILLSTLLISFNLSVTAQEKKNEPKGFIKFGYGYYIDMFMAFDDLKPDPITGLTQDNTPGGTALWIEGGYKLPNQIIVSANIMYAIVKEKYTDILFKDYEHINTHINYVINFSYELNKQGRHKFTPGIGLLVNSWTESKVEPWFSIDDNGELIISSINMINDTDYELGFNLNLDYHYQFKNNFFLGAKVNTVYLISIGLESIVFSPVIGVKF